jgi:hypothetical protein
MISSIQGPASDAEEKSSADNDVNESALDAEVKKFALAAYLRSTAPVLAVLPLWWVIDQGVPLGMYLSLMAFSSVAGLVLDAPTSMLADRLRPKHFVQMGTLFFSLSFTATLLFPGAVGFGLYLAFNTLAAACLSGADTALLFQLSGQKKFGENQSTISRNTYLLTMAVIPAGALVYMWDPRATIAFQAIALIASLIVVLLIRHTGARSDSASSMDEAIRSRFSSQLRSATPSASSHFVAVMTLLLATGTVEAIVSFNNRTFQLNAISDVDSPDATGIWFVVGGLMVGNLLSGYGANAARTFFARGVRFRVLLIAFLLALLISVGLMSVPYVWCAVVGYIIVAMIKGVARPVTLAAYANLKPDRAGASFWFTLMTLSSVGLGATVTWLGVAVAGDNIVALNGVYATLIVLALVLTALAFPWHPIAHSLPRSATSGKTTHLLTPVAAGQPRAVAQQYGSLPEGIDTHEIADRAQRSTLRSPGLLHAGEAELRWEWVPGSRLSEADEATCLAICQVIAKDLSTASSSTGQKLLQGPIALDCGCPPTVVHGDLHPDNVIVSSGSEYFVVDWDLSHVGRPLFDALLLFSHPWTPLSTEHRLDLIRRLTLCEQHSPSCRLRSVPTAQIIRTYLAWKIEQIESWPESVDFKSSLLAAYLVELSKYQGAS